MYLAANQSKKGCTREVDIRKLVGDHEITWGLDKRMAFE